MSPGWLGCHAAGHVLASRCCLGIEDPWESESYARQAEGPGWLARLIGRKDAWAGASWG